MHYELKKIDLWSAIKISFMINAIIGLAIGFLIGAFFALIFGILGNMAPSESPELVNIPLGPLGGFFFGMVYAVIIAVFNGIIMTSIAVILYNLFAGWLGGIKVDVGPVESEIGQPIMTIASNTNQQPDRQA
jgi:hypothetical protein